MIKTRKQELIHKNNIVENSKNPYYYKVRDQVMLENHHIWDLTLLWRLTLMELFD
jgi:hypothetical protein